MAHAEHCPIRPFTLERTIGGAPQIEGTREREVVRSESRIRGYENGLHGLLKLVLSNSEAEFSEKRLGNSRPG